MTDRKLSERMESDNKKNKGLTFIIWIPQYYVDEVKALEQELGRYKKNFNDDATFEQACKEIRDYNDAIAYIHVFFDKTTTHPVERGIRSLNLLGGRIENLDIKVKKLTEGNVSLRLQANQSDAKTQIELRKRIDAEDKLSKALNKLLELEESGNNFRAHAITSVMKKYLGG